MFPAGFPTFPEDRTGIIVNQLFNRTRVIRFGESDSNTKLRKNMRRRGCE